LQLVKKADEHIFLGVVGQDVEFLECRIEPFVARPQSLVKPGAVMEMHALGVRRIAVRIDRSNDRSGRGAGPDATSRRRHS
jgi:hypothetical protein